LLSAQEPVILSASVRVRFPEAAPTVDEVDEPAAVPDIRKLIETDYRYVIYYRVVDR